MIGRSQARRPRRASTTRRRRERLSSGSRLSARAGRTEAETSRGSTDRARCRYPPSRVPTLRLYPRSCFAPSLRSHVVNICHRSRFARPADAAPDPPLDPTSRAPRFAKVPRLDRPLAGHVAVPGRPLCPRPRSSRQQRRRGRIAPRGMGSPVPPVLECHSVVLARRGRHVGRPAERCRRRQGCLAESGGSQG